MVIYELITRYFNGIIYINPFYGGITSISGHSYGHRITLLARNTSYKPINMVYVYYPIEIASYTFINDHNCGDTPIYGWLTSLQFHAWVLRYL